MNEKPIERLKYFNGQRLEADDLKLEQEYHIRVRRWLNKALYSAGIAQGLEARPDSGNPQQVLISSGLAMDHEGREMILLEEKAVKVIGKPSAKDGQVDGNYLTIQYREETRAEESDSCTPKGNGHNHGQIAWSGPSRVRAEPILGWSDILPHESSGKVVLAQVELDNSCNVKNVYTYPRHYIGPASNMAVRQYALEGERHIDANNPGRIYFHIRGRQPNAVTLYLRADKFSTLYYTEMGHHKHDTSGGPANGTDPASSVDPHAHTLTNTTVKTDYRSHSHNIQANISKDIAYALPPNVPADPKHPKYMLATVFGPNPSAEELNPIVATGTNPLEGHDHAMAPGALTDTTPQVNPGTAFHIHSIGGTSVSIVDSGVKDEEARGNDPKKPEKALTYVDTLQVYIGKVDENGVPDPPPDTDNRTKQILTRLRELRPTIWNIDRAKDSQGEFVMGNGKPDHPLAKNGTGAIGLNMISDTSAFPEGEYYIELRVEGAGNGGRILYNLYVE